VHNSGRQAETQQLEQADIADVSLIVPLGKVSVEGLNHAHERVPHSRLFINLLNKSNTISIDLFVSSHFQYAGTCFLLASAVVGV
jgi:hypothetical protein